MEIKGFFRVTKRKVIITILIAVLLALFIFYGTCLTCADHAAALWELIPLYVFLWPAILISKAFNIVIGRSTAATDIVYGIIVIIINGAYLYIIGCRIDKLIEKAKSKR